LEKQNELDREFEKTYVFKPKTRRLSPFSNERTEELVNGVSKFLNKQKQALQEQKEKAEYFNKRDVAYYGEKRRSTTPNYKYISNSPIKSISPLKSNNLIKSKEIQIKYDSKIDNYETEKFDKAKEELHKCLRKINL